MLVNFALDVVGTKISSDKVSTDGHECANLISTDWHLRRKGFIAEHFIKPPVNITLEFPCPVWIHSVLVTPCVGQQRSSQLELYSASRHSTKAARNFKNLKSYTDASSMKGSGDSASPIFYAVSKVSFTESNRISFYNPTFSVHNNSDSKMDCQLKVVMSHFRKELTAACSHLTLRVIRTLGSSTAAVSNLEVWGVPAISLPTDVKEDIVNKYEQFLTPSNISKTGAQHTDLKDKDDVTTDKNSPSQCQKEGLSIPDEFVDPITCEVMAIPMLLPCGKNVDLSTLDQFNTTEASYGRKPRDPFTGVEFSDTSRPIPNGALKSRIDNFLMKHSEDSATSTIARTAGGSGQVSLLGKRKASEKLEVSSLILQPVVGNEAVTVNTSQHITCVINGKRPVKPEHSGVAICTQSDSRHNSAPRKLWNEKGNLNATANLNDEQNFDEIVCTKIDAGPSITGSNSDQIPSHENQLQRSLNDALTSILSGLPSYTGVATQDSSEQSNSLCSVCKTTLTTDMLTYILLCHHLICRQCLTTPEHAASKICCSICGKMCDRSHVTRSHHKLTASTCG